VEIYIIGFLFIFGYLLKVDDESETKRFSGFKGSATLLFTCLIWPMVIGYLVASITIDDR